MRSRIIGSLIVKDNIVVQSFGFKNYLPVGDVKICCENLNNWEVDEIIITSIDRSKYNLGPDLELIDEVSKSGISTPITYAGGIRNLNDAEKVISKGADRVCVNNLIMTNISSIKDIALSIGSQSLLASINIIKSKNNFFWFNYIKKKLLPIESIPLDLLHYVSEIIITDVNNEGLDDKFDLKVADITKKIFDKKKIIFFGGICTKKKTSLIKEKISNSSYAIGNFFSHKELANQYFK
tara:strand:- start:606 stop:1319 length:714 start_codon:yes stop_codon:yes gene_type:complete